MCSWTNNFCIKHKIVLFIIVTLVPYYIFSEYQEKINLNNVIFERKKELLSQINGDNNNLGIFPKTYAEENNRKEVENEKVIEILDKVNLTVEFYPQSPFWKWWPIFEDTCEEASALLAVNYVRWVTMTREKFRDELLKIVDFENNFFWYYKDTDVDETAQILEEYFKFSDYKILNEPTIEDMKKALSAWNIIITPLFASWMNLNYTWTWPDYHFIVIKGYDEDNFITHDVWTKMWENYKYDQLEIMERIHDFDELNMLDWEKKLIVLKKR